MATDTREPIRNYPIPDDDNTVSEEFPRLSITIEMIATDVGGLLTSVAGKAATVHTHAISGITGLQAALDEKLDADSASFALDDLADVDTTGAATFQVLMRVGSQWQPGVVDIANTTGLGTALAAATFSASQITSGTFDVARIPLLLSQSTILSSGAIAALTSGQQAQIVAGTHVTTTDGRRWVYSGSGSKTAEASYIELADVTPDWSVIANKPSTFTPATHTHTASQISDSGASGRAVVQAANAAAVRTAAGLDFGKQTIWVPANAMVSRKTNGAGDGSTETATNKIMRVTKDFDAVTQEYAQFTVRMPKSWNEGPVTFFPLWSHDTAATNYGVVWSLSGVAYTDGDTLDAALSASIGSTDVGGTAGVVYQGPESAGMTIAGTINFGDLVVFQVSREVANGSDTLAVDAKLHGVALLYTVDASRDD